jgi:hypothetical protein
MSVLPALSWPGLTRPPIKFDSAALSRGMGGRLKACHDKRGGRVKPGHDNVGDRLLKACHDNCGFSLRSGILSGPFKNPAARRIHPSPARQAFPARPSPHPRTKTGNSSVTFIRVRPARFVSSRRKVDSPQRRKDAEMAARTFKDPCCRRQGLLRASRAEFICGMSAAFGDELGISASLRLCGKSSSAIDRSLHPGGAPRMRKVWQHPPTPCGSARL